MTDIVDTVRQGIAKFTHQTACGLVGVETLAIHREVLEKLCDEIEKLRSQTKREWISLTDENIQRAIEVKDIFSLSDDEFAKTIEAKLREKNGC